MTYSSLASHWTLDPRFTFLNHGSFGATPRAILEEQTRLRQRLERQPVSFMERRLPPMLAESKTALANFVGARSSDIGFVTNATTGVNAVLRSIDLNPGDELLTTTHEYNAVQNALEFVAERNGAKVVVADVPFPVSSPDQIVEAVLAKASDRTRLAVLYHVSSPTALVMPVGRLVSALNERGIDTLIDGAHAPGMLDLNLDELGAAYYAGNCHKWMCTPKGVAFLHVRRDRQAAIRPTVISHGANANWGGSRFENEFDWQGTWDPTAWLCLPDVIHYVGSLVEGGWQAIREHNHQLAVRARRLLCDALGVEPACPEAMLGSMASVTLPDATIVSEGPNDPLHDELFHEHKIEVPVMVWPRPPKRILRVSAQLYNSEAQYTRLAEVLAKRFR